MSRAPRTTKYQTRPRPRLTRAEIVDRAIENLRAALLSDSTETEVEEAPFVVDDLVRVIARAALIATGVHPDKPHAINDPFDGSHQVLGTKAEILADMSRGHVLDAISAITAAGYAIVPRAPKTEAE